MDSRVSTVQTSEKGKRPSELSTKRIAFVSQKVKDIRVPANTDLSQKATKLRSYFHKRYFIPGNKIPVSIQPIAIEDGVVIADLRGNFLSSDLDIGIHITPRLPVGLYNYAGRLETEAVFSAVPGAEVGDGGNIQNMVVNMAYAVSNLQNLGPGIFPSIRLTIASSSDPLVRVPDPLAKQLREVCDIHPLDLSDRFAIHIRWVVDEHESGTLALSAEAERTDKPLHNLLRTDHEFREQFSRASCFVSADPIYDQLSEFARPPFVTVINASTAFRGLVAAESFRRAVLLPMNHGEAADVCKDLLRRVLEEEPERIPRPDFPSPIAPDGDSIDVEALKTLEQSLALFGTYIPWGPPSFTCPISFGEHGGLVVRASRANMNLACFTSVPSEAEVKSLLLEFGDSQTANETNHYEMGAGDAVATIIALFNTVSPSPFIQRFCQGAEASHERLMDVAGTIFVSMLSRVVGAFLLSTPATSWLNIRSDAFGPLLFAVAQESLSVARGTMHKLQKPVVRTMKWGIKTVIWQPGTIDIVEVPSDL